MINNKKTKTVLFLTILAIILFLSGLQLYSLLSQGKDKFFKKLHVELKTLEGVYFNTNDLPFKETLIFFIDPDCNECVADIRFIKKNESILSTHFNILLITTSVEEKIKDFVQKYAINTEITHILLDEDFKTFIEYEVNSFPTCLHFDKDKNLVRVIEGALMSTHQLGLQ